MNESQVFSWAANYGPGMVFATFMGLFSWWLIRYVLRTSSERENKLVLILQSHQEHIGKNLIDLSGMLTLAGTEAQGRHQSIQETSRFQREEHMAIMKNQTDLAVKLVEFTKVVQDFECQAGRPIQSTLK